MNASKDASIPVTYNSQSSFDIQSYLTAEGRSPYANWLIGLKDKQARARVLVRINRMSAGIFGDCKPIDQGVWELRIDWGPGYRVYYAQAGQKLILLLAGGDKRKQQADITHALNYWNDWQQRRTKR